MNIQEKKFRIKWSQMKTRCFNKNRKDYFRYGGRGITVSEAWLDFKNFKKDMWENFELGLSLDRIDNNKGYSKENCRWTTKKEQANNRRNNHIVEFNGMKKTLAQWAESLNIRVGTLNQRYFTYKWSIDKCLTYNRGGTQIG